MLKVYLLPAILICFYSVHAVIVQVEQGLLRGEQLETVTRDGRYYSFKGIPYAAPPVGSLRFKAPQPPLPWNGIREAKEHGPKCIQYDVFRDKFIPGSEDCLFVNVYTPDLHPKRALPVMVFIHGGGWASGSGDVDDLGPDFLVGFDVIVVTLNYRLEVLGFLCLHTKEAPGNAGLKDHVAALSWVQRNINRFGGDPDNVTIIGQSVGGVATSFHLLSPLSKGLFRRSISMSGTALSSFADAFEPRRKAFLLGKQLGLETEDPTELLEFLQSVPPEKLIHAITPLFASEVNTYIFYQMYFAPVIEIDFGGNHFMTEDVLTALECSVNEADVMIGNTNEEVLSLLFIPGYDAKVTALQKYPEMLVPTQISHYTTPNIVLNIADQVRKYYFGQKSISLTNIRELLNFANEICFTYSTPRFLNRLPKIGNSKRYLYQFSGVSKRNIYGMMGADKYGIRGAGHRDDLAYVFDPKVANLTIKKGSREYKMVHQTCSLFTNFAKYGNPTPPWFKGPTWYEYDISEQHYMDIDEALTPGQYLFADEVAFWTDIYQYAGIEF